MAKGKEAPAPALGIGDLCKAMDITPQTARLKLRKANIKRAGKSYGWKNKTDMAATIKKLQAVAA